MKITNHRALTLAIAALGDCARTIDNVGYSKAFASEVREAADHLTALREKEPAPVPRETNEEPNPNPTSRSQPPATPPAGPLP